MLQGEFIGQSDPLVLTEVSLPPELGFNRLSSGKIRDRFRAPNGDLVLITTDKVSAFDVVLGSVPNKGVSLNHLSEFWFNRTSDIIPNHIVEIPDPNVMIVRETTPLPVEVVVRGRITGVTNTSIWGSYEKGDREIYGIHFRDGYKKNDLLDEPVITPTTKAMVGLHDQRITEKEIIQGLIDQNDWQYIKEASLSIFDRARQIARSSGFEVADTKLEFGKVNGKIILIDELLTPDSTRYWLLETLDQRLSKVEEPDNYDKEYLRIAYKSLGYKGLGSPPPLPISLRDEVTGRYKIVTERITGNKLHPPGQDIKERIISNLSRYYDM